MTTVTATTRYGTARAAAWDRLHQQLAARAGWEDHDGTLPIIDGTLIRLDVDHLPGDRSPEPLWLWSSRADTDADAVNRTWQAFLRRFDIEHMFRFLKQVLGWTRPKLRDPAAADRWTWLIIACYAQLYLARDLAADIRLPWQRPCPPGRLTPARVRRGFRTIRQALPGLAGVVCRWSLAGRVSRRLAAGMLECRTGRAAFGCGPGAHRPGLLALRSASGLGLARRCGQACPDSVQPSW